METFDENRVTDVEEIVLSRRPLPENKEEVQIVLQWNPASNYLIDPETQHTHLL